MDGLEEDAKAVKGERMLGERKEVESQGGIEEVPDTRRCIQADPISPRERRRKGFKF